jgi:hypothetical protein
MVAVASTPESVFEPVNLVHPIVQDRHDADLAIGERLPIDEMAFIAADIAVQAELRRNGTPRKASLRYGGEAGEKTPDIAVRLGFTPGLVCVAVDLVELLFGSVLDPEPTDASERRPRLMTVSASSGR